jgi:protein involved in polysaccharide export with SLBB domain
MTPVPWAVPGFAGDRFASTIRGPGALHGKPNEILRVLHPRRRSCALLACACLLSAACSNFEEKRIRELQKEKGFGTRAQGDASVENYVAGGDLVSFDLSPLTYQDPSAALLFQLTLPQAVGIDGTINIPYVGPVSVLGKTQAELTTLVKGLLQPSFKFPLELQARIAGDFKHIFAFGEVGHRGAVPIKQFGGSDLTLLSVVSQLDWTNLANIGRVYLIRPDAEHPLVVEVNLNEMILSGRTNWNLSVRENDIIYIPPTFLGMIARILERVLAPVALAVRAMFGIAEVRESWAVASGQAGNPIFFRF